VFACLLEYVPNGTLEDQLKRDYNLPRKEKKTWKGTFLKLALEIALAMQYVHNARYHDEKTDLWKECIIHRDLKPDNMLITNDWCLKLTDFGEARAVDLLENMTQVGTPIYVAPEIMKNDLYDERVDVYSFAICLIAMLRAEKNVANFFVEGLKKDLGKKTMFGIGIMVLNNKMHNEGYRPKLPKTLYPSLAKLIVECWNEKAIFRPSFSQIVERLRGDITMEVLLNEEPNFCIVYEDIDDMVCGGGGDKQNNPAPRSVDFDINDHSSTRATL